MLDYPLLSWYLTLNWGIWINWSDVDHVLFEQIGKCNVFSSSNHPSSIFNYQWRLSILEILLPLERLLSGPWRKRWCWPINSPLAKHTRDYWLVTELHHSLLSYFVEINDKNDQNNDKLSRHPFTISLQKITPSSDKINSDKNNF